MNYFFGYSGNGFKAQLNVPKFQNRSTPRSNIGLWSIEIHGGLWKINPEDVKQDSYFFYINSDKINNHKVFILATKKEISNFNKKELKSINSYTSTLPAFRSNFKLIHTKGGFSSYQSEYPSNMVGKKGSIISNIKSLLDPNASKNFILLRNIYILPKKTLFNSYLIDYKSKKILCKYKLQTNKTNFIPIDKKHILPNVFLFTDGYLGIPIYVSQNNQHLSMEHTHPPHSYILSNNVFKKVSEFKKEFHEIIHS
ncbi:hypothetical protein OA331_00030 [Bacteroidota bacterium]|nr:hypothetical protein [Bacteroidota bacterium]